MSQERNDNVVFCTLDEARETLQKLAAVVFDEERREAEELIAGKDVVRESFFVPIPRTA